ncbi:MAG: HIT domain-containing protein, partial [Nanoarchaeota archaeon]|nr:HIT domain-containing protein [Nanoarchaeota archaeon]
MVTQEELEKMSPEEIAELQRKNCIFCKIISGEVPGAKIFENDTTVSILDINPATKGHALIMPKEHVPILPLVPPEIFSPLFLDAKSIATAIKQVTLAGSTAVFIANGALAGQQAPHFIFHIIPDHSFSFPAKPELKEKNESLAASLKHNLGLMMSRQGSVHSQENQPSQEQIPPQQAQAPSPQDLAKRREQIAKIIEENADVRDLLTRDVEA